MVLTVSFVLSPATGLSCHRRSREALTPQELDASVGASGPHDFAVRIGTLVSRTAASTASHPNVRDDGQRPSCGTGWRELVALICPTGKAEYFCERGWTGKSVICPSGNEEEKILLLILLRSAGAANDKASYPITQQ
jgi:hypothetical protein